jgi:signal transduction histidine kinase
MNKSLVKLYVLATALLVLAAGVIFTNNKSGVKLENLVSKFNHSIEENTEILDNALNDYQVVLSDSLKDYWPLLERVDRKYDFLVFIYKNNNLIFWNTSNVLPEEIPENDSVFLIETANGWYLGKYKRVGEFEVLLLDIVETVYSVNNQYINNCFNPKYLDCQHTVNIEIVNSTDNFRIPFFEDENIYLSIGNERISNKIQAGRLGMMLLFYLILLLLISEIGFALNRSSGFIQIIALLITLCLLSLDYYFGFTITFSGLSLKDVDTMFYAEITYFAIVLFISIVFIINLHKKYNPDENKFVEKKIAKRFSLIVTLIVFSIVSVFFVSLFISKSGITEVYSLVSSSLGYAISLIIFLCFLLLYLLFLESIRLFDIVPGNKILYSLVFMIVLAIFFSVSINKSIESTNDIRQKKIIGFLSKSGDKAIVKFWEGLQKALSVDKEFDTMLLNPGFVENELENYFYEKYLNKEISRFESQLTVCSNSDLLEFEAGDIVLNCSNYFEDIKSLALDSVETNLYLINNEPDDIYYLGEIVLSDTLRAYVEFYSFFIPGGLGYAELLIDKKPDVPDLSDYSFAKYSNAKLTSKFGNYEYHTTVDIFLDHVDGQSFVMNNYKHRLVSLNPDNILIVSRPVQRLTVSLVSFSLLFLMFVVGSLLVMVFVFGSGFRQASRLNFRTRMQTFFMLALISILLSTSLIVMYYADANSKIVLENQMNEKAHSVLIELQHKLKDYPTLESFDKNELSLLLQKFSMVFFSDINLYDTHGKMIASSRPKIIEQGLLSEMINPRAYEEIFVDKLLYYNTTEKIGGMEYYSSYLPLVLSGNEVAGIINLPYFARQKEQRQSFRLLLFTFINLFVVFGIIGTIIALFYSSLLIRPLTELQQNLANIRIDTQNEKIKWHSNDEIGLLIEEYNSMLDKLEASAEILKRSEREIAWREVAMQIAHEIRNPLTPMKLNIQYLEKSFMDDPARFEKKLKEISQALIQQIETLNKVAGTFSDMAKSSIKKFKGVDLLASLKTAIKLFDNSNNIAISLLLPGEEKVFITKGLEKEIVQIFNNLLKNSIEAIGDKENGLVEITVSRGVSFHTVVITDNGNGIPAGVKQSVFTPYFTTRSKGTGLGLAIVKTLITGMGGDIRLKSSGPEGTSFELKFLISLSSDPQ